MKIDLQIITVNTLLLAFLVGCGGNGAQNGPSFSLNDIPAEKTIQENSGNLTVMSLTTERNSPYRYRISGADKAYFTIDNDNNLRFLEQPDYEQKSIYRITIEVYRDNTKQTQKSVVIKIADDPTDNQDRTAPEITTQSPLHIDENSLFIADINATEEHNILFSISGGADRERFLIDSSGKLTFNHFTPDYEHPSDSDHDNRYEVQIRVEDNASNASAKDFTVMVDNVEDTGNATDAKVLKTGLNDAPGNTPGFGSPRNISKEGDTIVSVGGNELYWEDTDHVNADVTFDEAAAYCASLTLGGRNWRVPTRKELFTLVNYGNYPTMLDAEITHRNNGDFWTKSTLLEGRVHNGQNFEVTEKGWYISFKFGDDDFRDKTDRLHVRCVSGGTQFSNSGNFENENGYIRDTLTGLEWENNSSAIAGHLTWQEAKARCEALPGGTWRLPNINELHTLMPENGMDVLLYNKLEPELSIGPFWSSSVVPYNNQQAFYIENREYADPGCNDNDDQTVCRYGDTQNNAVENQETNGSIRSICVRGGVL